MFRHLKERGKACRNSIIETHLRKLNAQVCHLPAYSLDTRTIQRRGAERIVFLMANPLKLKMGK